MGKIYEKITLQETVNLLMESNFLMQKMSMHIKKTKIHLKPWFI